MQRTRDHSQKTVAYGQKEGGECGGIDANKRPSLSPSTPQMCQPSPGSPGIQEGYGRKGLIQSLDYSTGQTFNYYNDQFLMGKVLLLCFCKLMRLAGIPPSAGKEEIIRPEFAEMMFV